MDFRSGLHLKRKASVEKFKKIPERKRRISKESLEECFEVELKNTSQYLETDVSAQTDQLMFFQKKIDKLSKKLEKTQLTYSALENDHQKCYYYTGLDFPTLKMVFEQIQVLLPSTVVSDLDPFQQIVLTFMKLRLNLSFRDLGYRFGISQATCSSYFNSVIDIMYERFKSHITWLGREELMKIMPICFREVFSERTTIIVDSFEVAIEKPSGVVSRQVCGLNYKHNQIIKFLIGVTPQATISYVSNAWDDSRTSDKHILEQSSFLNKLTSNHVVLADRSFAVKESLAVLQPKLILPAFIVRNKQLVPIRIEDTRKLAHIRIHIKKIINSIKSKYLILKGIIPISLLTDTNNDLTILDKIVVVCSAMINICPPVVPL